MRTTTMQIELAITLNSGDDERTYTLRTDRAYSRVPVAGEIVSLDDGDGSIELPIDAVVWSNDGLVTFEFDVEEGDSPVTEAWLMSHGYERFES
jgi:hypothetical protein